MARLQTKIEKGIRRQSQEFNFKETLDYIIQEYNDDTNFPWRNSPTMSGEEKFDELLKMIRLDLNELKLRGE